ncbi:extensin-like [Lathyrus oleraceus]|uniref:extensin-like n=1 Tax=Pisum sativum TaxID=3888 RepID=UPI0021D238BB|nr:extensin-like [Pisum sativum]
MGIIDQVRAKPTLDTSWEELRDQREIPNGLYLFSKIDPPEVVTYYLQDLANQGVDISDITVDWLPEHPTNFMKRMREPSEKSKKAKKARLGESSGSRPPVPLAGSPSKSVPLSRSVKIKPLASYLPQTTSIYTTSDTPPSTTRTFNPPSLKFNLATTTLPISEVEMLNETTSPSSSPSLQSPPYYELSSDTGPSDPQSPTLTQLQAHALASQQPSHSELEPEVTFSPPEHPNPTTSKQTPPPAQQPIPFEPQPTQPSFEPHPEPQQTTQSPSDIPPPITSAASITPTFNLSAPNSLSPPSLTPATEPETTILTLEEAIQVFAESSVEKVKEDEAKAAADAAAAAAAAEAMTKAKADAEESTRITEEAAAKANTDALTQGENSNSGFVPLVLKTLEELQKEQQN